MSATGIYNSRMISGGGDVQARGKRGAGRASLARGGRRTVGADISDWRRRRAQRLSDRARSGQMMATLREEQRRTQRAHEVLSHYVPPQLIEQLLADPDGAVLGGQSREVTVLFADIRGYCLIAEALNDQPERLADLISAVLEPLTDIVLAHGGVLDKYMGDCLMAFWGVPGDDTDHAQQALAAAQAMIAAGPVINAVARAVLGEHDLPAIEIGVGINSGDCIVGNVGCRRRYDYSVLGDPVNVASRLQELCKHYQRPILLGEATALRLAGVTPLIEVDRTAIRGRTALQGVFAPGTSHRTEGPCA